MRHRSSIIIMVLQVFLLSWLALGCSPAGTPAAAVGQTEGLPGRTPSPTRYYDVALPPKTATAKAQSPIPAATTSSSSGGVRLTVLHTNDSRGYVDPCG